MQPPRTVGSADQLRSGAETAYSVEKVLDRLATARSQANKEAHRFFIAALLFVALYMVKVAGLRADLVLLDQKILEVPYGLFFFLIISQFAFCFYTIRLSDAKAYDSYMRAFCDEVWEEQGEKVHTTYPNEYAWLSPTSYVLDLATGAGFRKVTFAIITLFTMFVALAVNVSPILAGCYYLYSWENQIVSGNIDLQYNIVLVTTALTFAWFVNYVIVHYLTDRLRSK